MVLNMWIKKGQYYIKRKKNSSEIAVDNYWSLKLDPDGKERDPFKEKKRKIKDCKREIEYINGLKPGRILDIGCGLGYFLSAINKKWDKYGLEISSKAVKEAEKYCTVYCGDLKEAAYKDSYFDVVFSYNVIEHVENPEEMVTEAYRILKRKGKIIIGTANFDSACARRFGDRYRMFHDETHISLFSDYSLREMLEDFGFEVEYIDYPYFETEHFSKENLMRLFDTEKWSPPFYGNLFTIYAYKK